MKYNWDKLLKNYWCLAFEEVTTSYHCEILTLVEPLTKKIFLINTKADIMVDAKKTVAQNETNYESILKSFPTYLGKISQ